MKNNFAPLIQEAHTVAHAAAMNCTPVPMHVFGMGTNEIVNDGVCGFASVRFKGNTAFGRYMKKNNLAWSAYGGGLSMSIHQYNQSYERKTAYARAFAGVLKDAGIDAWAEGRLD